MSGDVFCSCRLTATPRAEIVRQSEDRAHTEVTRMRRSIGLVGLLAAGMATAVGAAGCGGGGGLDGSAVAQAAKATQAAKTARVSLTMSVAGQTLHGSGYMDLKRRAADLSISTPQGTMREIFTGTRLYLRLPKSLRNGSLGNKPWAAVDLRAVAKAKGIDVGALQTQSDPSQTLDQLRAAGKVHKVGTETVRGTETTHFTAVIDLRKAAARQPRALRAAAKRSTEVIIRQLGVSSLPIDVWLDSHKRVRREQLRLPVRGASMRLTIEMYDFGTSHQLTTPPADQVTDVTRQAAAR
jgi:hypothetical protein